MSDVESVDRRRFLLGLGALAGYGILSTVTQVIDTTNAATIAIAQAQSQREKLEYEFRVKKAYYEALKRGDWASVL